MPEARDPHSSSPVTRPRRSRDNALMKAQDAAGQDIPISAQVSSAQGRHGVSLSTRGRVHEVSLPGGPDGFGSAVNGGELLCLAIATCFCNDVYREARQRDIEVIAVEVTAHATFGGPGDAASAIAYRARVTARAREDAIRALIVHTDRVAEVHNTLRKGMPVELEAFETIPQTA